MAEDLNAGSRLDSRQLFCHQKLILLIGDAWNHFFLIYGEGRSHSVEHKRKRMNRLDGEVHGSHEEV